MNPADLRVDGIAILAFGKASLMPSSAPTGAPNTRCLRAPIRALTTGDDVKAFMAAQRNMQEEVSSAIALAVPDSERMLQEANLSEFGLQVGLAGINGDASDDKGSSSSAAIAADCRRCRLGCPCRLCGSLLFLPRQEEPQEADHHHR